ncbi:uncharacterized protein E0L32_009611 [Thyridium curvatum]|uniref:Adenylate cyclase n=1 Tax=Thyridium curvatum TaxID=1093900 RepID=A0A507ANJ3_9PEZI|nr:uncharacterized protein E0L32_009611 [Thyridium curvatum]TPX08907.1 hypothetical protein E0L32_009611 [Thyridium curvatum]
MARNDAASRIGSVASSSTDSARSAATVKPLPATPSSSNSLDTKSKTKINKDDSLASRRPGAPSQLKRDENGKLASDPAPLDEGQLSPTSGPRMPRSPTSNSYSNTSARDQRRMSDLTNYRRDLAVLDSSGNRGPSTQHGTPATGPSSSLRNIAPWMSSNGGSGSTPASSSGGALPTSFYNDSSDNISIASQLSPSFNTGPRPSQTSVSFDSPDAPYFDDQRRPSLASITTTASSQGSKASGTRGGMRKLQGFFGEEFPGRESSDASTPPAVPGKDSRSLSYSQGRPQRDRNYSNATDHTRDASPSSSRPRTPAPNPEVLPFLYQDSEDIARYGEAPVRDILSGPDRERYMPDNSTQIPPKTSSSSRSGHSIVHLPGHHHRYNKSNDDPRALRPTTSREDSTVSVPQSRTGTPLYSKMSRAPSPTPSGHGTIPTPVASKSMPVDDVSPGHHKKGLLGRLRRNHKEKEEHHHLKKVGSVASHTLSARPSRTEFPRTESFGQSAPALPGRIIEPTDSPSLRPAGGSRQPTFNNKFPFHKKGKGHRYNDETEEAVGPTEGKKDGKAFFLDTDLENMEGILSRPLPLTPMDAEILKTNAEAEKQRKPSESSQITLPPPAANIPGGPNGAWNAPDSWAVRRTADEIAAQQIPEIEEFGSPPRPGEKMTQYCIRVFKSDGTFATLQLPLDAAVSDMISNLARKAFTENLNYHIVFKRHDLLRILGSGERPLLIQKRLLQQAGYEDNDRIEDLGREDNSYLCRFLFLSARESDFHAKTHDLGLGRLQKFNHVDLSGRNLVTIPITLYSKAGEIISLNLSRNLSLDVPRDFISSCQNLRDVKFNNNEARKLPPSLGRASKLTYLDVSNNRLEQLEHAELNGLAGLLKLNLSNNRLKYLPPYFGAYHSLRTLNLSSNFLEKFPSFLCELESLVDLDMSFNLIAHIPEDIGRLQNLEKFVITNNRLSGTLPQHFDKLSSLRELDIKFNAITAIDVISHLPKLEILTADHNAISQFTGSFERIRSLKLNANPITNFILNMPILTLKNLNLSNCQLASIDESFNNMTSLERLVLDKNYFVSLPNQIGNLRRLEHFSIAHNSVGELPQEIGCLTELRVLDVRGNNIRKLPMEIWWANKLETLNASSNVLENFPKPASRPPQAPNGDSPRIGLNSRSNTVGTLSATPSEEEIHLDALRRPSQASSTLLSVGPSPVPPGPDRKGSVVSVYGKGGRKTSVVSRATTTNQSGSMTPSANLRKDSGLSARLINTFAGSLRNLYLADNQLDDDIFDQITLLAELRVLNLSYNDLSDMPQRSIKNWPQLVELYLSGNELASLPADDLEEYSLLQVLHINSNKFTNLPADISRAKKLAVLDCGSNFLKYNISNVPYDWNWNLNPNLRFLNLSGNRRLEIKQTVFGAGAANREQYTDFNRLMNLRVLGLMDVTLTQPSIPDQSEDRRVRTSGSLAGYLPYGMADTLGKNEHLSTIDLVVPRFNSSDTETLLGLFDGQALSSGGSKIAKYLHENFGHIFTMELKALKTRKDEGPKDALRRAFLSLNKDLITIGLQTNEERPLMSHRGSAAAPMVLSKEDLNSGGVATVAYLQSQELYVANVGDAQAMLISNDGSHKFLTKKHDPAEPSERSRIRDAGGWVSRNGRLNDLLEVSRAFGYSDLMPAVMAAPNIHHVTVREQDETVLIATRELWEYLSPGLVVDIARQERGDLMRAAQKLRDLAMAYGATNKLMVMMISVADLKRRNERSRLHRGQSMSLYPSGVPDEAQFQPARRLKKKCEVLDSTLQRLEAEVPAPTGMIAIVFTDIKNSTNLWETYPAAMRSAIKLHNEVMRRQLRRIGGFEVKTEGDAFMVSFPTATSALLWCFAVQMSLLEVPWPSEMLNSVSCQPMVDKDNNVIFKGLSVRMGTHWGEPLCEPDPITRRMDYYGPMVNKASRISAVADGGQITVSSDFISEIQRCLETYQESAPGADDLFEDDTFAQAIRKELRSLSSQGFEVKEMGEKKLKGLENPEVVYSLYPHALAGRVDAHQAHDRQVNELAVGAPANKIATREPGVEIAVEPEAIFALWRVSLRLEMLCSSLEEVSGRGLQPPETELLERMKQRSSEMTERFLVNFMEHQVSRIETCITTLSLRHMAAGGGHLAQLGDLRAPMSDVMQSVAEQLAELQRYKALFGEIGPAQVQGVVVVDDDGDEGFDEGEDDSEGGSETE